MPARARCCKCHGPGPCATIAATAVSSRLFTRLLVAAKARLGRGCHQCHGSGPADRNSLPANQAGAAAGRVASAHLGYGEGAGLSCCVRLGDDNREAGLPVRVLHPRVRPVRVATFLSRFAPPPERRLGDEAAGVRVAAAEGVGRLASRLDGGARAALRARLEDPDLGVRTAAEQALQRLA